MSGERVLIVEDDERSATLAQAVVSAAGYQAESARDLDGARACLDGDLPAVVLLDLRLPDGPGQALAREIRARAGGDRVLLLAVTASVLEAVRREALEAGCDDFVEKPISPRDLLARIERGLAARAWQ